MAEYYVVLKKAVSAVDPGASDARRSIYDKARSALIGQLKAIDPPLSTSEISRQRLELEEAIRRVEREALSAPSQHFDTSSLDAPRARDQRKPSQVRRPVVEEPVEVDLDGFDADADERDDEEDWREEERGRPQPREIFQRAVRESEKRPAERRARRDEPEDYDPPPPPPPRRAEPERRPPPSRRELRADPPEPAAYEPRLQSDYEEEPALAPEPTVERRPKNSRKERADRPPPRIQERGEPDLAPPRRSKAPLIILLILLLAVGAGAGYAYFKVPMARQMVASVINTINKPDKAAPAGTDSTPAPAASNPADKLGDRIGQPSDRAVRSVDGGQAGSVGTAATATTAPPASAQTAPPPAPAPGSSATASANPPPAGIPVSQKATLYEESLNKEGQVSATLEGTVVWRFVQGGADGPAIEGVINIPDRKLRLQLSIRRNTDNALPASHLVELAVSVPADYPGGGITDIPRLVLKGDESKAGQPLTGVARKVVEGLFWIALSNDKKTIGTNMTLLRSNAFVDVPLLYKSGQRAILTVTKGQQGSQVFEQALAAWGN